MTLGQSEGPQGCAGQMGSGHVPFHQPHCNPLAQEDTGPSGDNQGQTVQGYIPDPPSSEALHFPFVLVPCVFGEVRKEERGPEVSALPFLGSVSLHAQDVTHSGSWVWK